MRRHAGWSRPNAERSWTSPWTAIAFLLKAAFGGVRTPGDLSWGLAGIA